MPERPSWIRSNIGTIITIALLSAAIVGQWERFGQAAELAKAADSRLRIHEMDNQRHIDPVRDEQRWDELMRRLERIEGKID